jgi:hypothetical protein
MDNWLQIKQQMSIKQFKSNINEIYKKRTYRDLRVVGDTQVERKRDAGTGLVITKNNQANFEAIMDNLRSNYRNYYFSFFRRFALSKLCHIQCIPGESRTPPLPLIVPPHPELESVFEGASVKDST